jgi:DNA polymerase delta subunit 1
MIAHNLCYTTLMFDKVYSQKSSIQCVLYSEYTRALTSANSCYTTLMVYKDDMSHVGPECCSQAPADSTFSAGVEGSWFCNAEVQQGLLPLLLQQLLDLRVAAKAKMQAPHLQAVERMALDSRQRALKLCANAAYGFAGAATSPVQSVPVAEAVLLHGAAMCRRAIELAESPKLAEDMGLKAKGIGVPRVVYAQTDSIFVLLPNASILQAQDVGRALADAITTEIKMAPVKLNYESSLGTNSQNLKLHSGMI